MWIKIPKEDLIEKLSDWEEYKLYDSNIWFILILDDRVYKVFENQDIYKKELQYYKIFWENGILVPEYKWLWEQDWYYILRLENIRKDFKRKDSILNLGIERIAELLKKIHSLPFTEALTQTLSQGERRNIVLWDVHVSNFFEKKWEERLGVFDFSSSQVWDREADIACLYIEININDDILARFLEAYGSEIDREKLYKYTVLELQEMIKNGMNLGREAKMRYYKYLLVLKEKMSINKK